MTSVMPPSAPFCSGCRWQCVCVMKTVVTTGPVQKAPTQTAAVIARKIKHKHFQKESKFPLPLIMCQVPSRRSTTQTNPTPRYMGRVLAGHPRSVRLGFGDYKMRILTSVRSKTPAIQLRSSHLSAEQGHSRPAL